MSNPVRPHRTGLVAVLIAGDPRWRAPPRARPRPRARPTPTTTHPGHQRDDRSDEDDDPKARPTTTERPGTTPSPARDVADRRARGSAHRRRDRGGLRRRPVVVLRGRRDEVFSRDDVGASRPKWVSAIGVEAFQAAGVTPADIESGDAGIQDVELDRTAAEAIVDAIPECGLTLIDLFIDGLPSRVKDDPAKVACVEAP